MKTYQYRASNLNCIIILLALVSYLAEVNSGPPIKTVNSCILSESPIALSMQDNVNHFSS